MTYSSNDNSANTIRKRLLKAALDCFLADEYHKVTTRQIAQKANANIAMIRYYFGNKEGLYEAMISDTLKPLLDALDQQSCSAAGFNHFFHLYYQTMSRYPDFPKLILKVLTLNQGPGKRFIYQLLERGRSRNNEKINLLTQQGQLPATIDPDIVRMSFVSLAITPMLLKNNFQEWQSLFTDCKLKLTEIVSLRTFGHIMVLQAID